MKFKNIVVAATLPCLAVILSACSSETRVETEQLKQEVRTDVNESFDALKTLETSGLKADCNCPPKGAKKDN